MIEFEKPNIKCLEIDKANNYGKFVCEPLERGYGITIGNSLRRIMLSSLPGAAIKSVKIEGADNEFTTIPGVVEDVPELILNLKMVRLKLDQNEEKNIRIDFNKEGEVATLQTIRTAKKALRASCEKIKELINPCYRCVARFNCRCNSDVGQWL